MSTFMDKFVRRRICNGYRIYENRKAIFNLRISPNKRWGTFLHRIMSLYERWRTSLHRVMSLYERWGTSYYRIMYVCER